MESYEIMKTECMAEQFRSFVYRHQFIDQNEIRVSEYAFGEWNEITEEKLRRRKPKAFLTKHYLYTAWRLAFCQHKQGSLSLTL